jgi:hypothetical protein
MSLRIETAYDRLCHASLEWEDVEALANSLVGPEGLNRQTIEALAVAAAVA